MARHSSHFLRASAIAAALLLAVLTDRAQAATYLWTGNGLNDRWSNAANWDGNAAPNLADASPDILVFPAGAAQTTIFNDLADGSEVVTLRFQAPYVLNGNLLRIATRVEVSFDGNGHVRFNCPVVLGPSGALGGTVTVWTDHLLLWAASVSGNLFSSLRKEGPGSLALGAVNTYAGPTTIAEGMIEANGPGRLGQVTGPTSVLAGATLRVSSTSVTIDEPITIAGPGAFGLTISGAISITGAGNVLSNVTIGSEDATIHVGDGVTATISDVLDGAAGLSKRGFGTLVLAGAGGNTYTGRTRHYAGTLVLQKGIAVAVPNGLDIEAGVVRLEGANAIQGTVTVADGGTLNLNDRSDVIASLSGAGQVQLGAGVLRLDGLGAATFSGSISGTGQVILDSGTATLSGASTFTGGLRIEGGAAVIDGGLQSTVVVLNGVLRGSGSTRALIANDGLVETGFTQLEVNGDATLHASAIVQAGLRNDGNGNLDVTGTVTINQAALLLTIDPGFVPTNDTHVLIYNDGTDNVVGEFLNRPEGSLFTVADRLFRISYHGGTGNDVVLRSLITDYHLSEGATGAFFDTDLLIANPDEVPAPVEVRYLKPGGEVITQTLTVPAMSRATIRVDEIAGLENTEVSMIVRSVDGWQLLVERTMRWSAAGYGAHTEKAVGGPSTTWYFAEGAQGFFSTYLLLANPNAAANTATVQYLRENASAITRSYEIGPYARLTVDAGADEELRGQSFGMIVTFATAGVAERSMYFGDTPLWNAGHESAGVPSPSTTWFLAEGATGPFFETFVLVANPTDAAADIDVTFLPDTGVPIAKTKTVPAHGRLTINIEAEDAALANAAVATRVVSSVPVVVERAQYWPDPAPSWYEAHNSFGVTEPGTAWGLAEGRVGGAEGYQTYILLANPDPAASANVALTFLREGKPAFSKTFTVNPTSRFNVSTGPGSLVPELQDEKFGVVIHSTTPVVVERAMYSNAGGQVWSAGTNATATKLPPVVP